MSLFRRKMNIRWFYVATTSLVLLLAAILGLTLGLLLPRQNDSKSGNASNNNKDEVETGTATPNQSPSIGDDNGTNGENDPTFPTPSPSFIDLNDNDGTNDPSAEVTPPQPTFGINFEFHNFFGEPLRCPEVGTGPVTLDSNGNELVGLHVFDDLCMIWRIQGANGEKRVPVVRSYNNYDWEPYAGVMATKMRVLCENSVCVTWLPPLESTDQHYEIVSFNHSLSETNQVARFLEQATFGPTRETIETFPSSPAHWIKEQMNLPYSSHRRFFRERLNHRTATPNALGVPSHPCAEGTKYRRYAFMEKDSRQMLEIRTDPLTLRKILLRDGQARTVLSTIDLYFRTPRELVPDGFYEVCPVVGPRVGSRFLIRRGARCTQLLDQDLEVVGNPEVYFDTQTPPTNEMLDLDGRAAEYSTDFYPGAQDTVQELILLSSVDDFSVCSIAPVVSSLPPFEVVGVFDGKFFLHDPRWSILSNSVDSPLSDGGGSVHDLVDAAASERNRNRYICPNVEMNFQNQLGCRLSASSTYCEPPRAENAGRIVVAELELSRRNLRALYAATNGAQVPYVVTGLRQDESGLPYELPCAPSARSRYILVESVSCNEGNLGPLTVTNIANRLTNSADSHPFVRDIFAPATGTFCEDADVSKYDFQVWTGSQCWQNVHQDEYQVFDFSQWVQKHPGGSEAILQFADIANNFTLYFPWWHPMSRWYDEGAPFRTELGRFGDSVHLRLPENVAIRVGAKIISGQVNDEAPVSRIVCGSPDEVANDADLEGRFRRGAFDAVSFRNQTSAVNSLRRQKLYAWLAVILSASDQLRQKVAWALSQLLVITPSSVEANNQLMTEAFVAYYDIFVRHAFGNYRDILREVTFSPLMGEMLSYVGSRSTAYVWQNERRLEYPDENYAREVMQLFSIGLKLLHTNGTAVLDSSGHEIPTYSNAEITEYSRLYTGIVRRSRRGNIEDRLPGDEMNPIDPMTIDLDYRDTLPKLGLLGRYVGDGLPLCTELPAGAFLKTGARYRLLGYGTAGALLSEPKDWNGNQAVQRLQVDQSSPLYAKLCGSSITDSCTFTAEIVLDEDVECSGLLCEAHEIRILQVDSVFYEYVRPPCSKLAFFNDGQAVREYGEQLYCENPRSNDGTAGCCAEDGQAAQSFNLYSGERMSFARAVERCSLEGLQLCHTLPVDCIESRTCDTTIGQWIDKPCAVHAKIDLEGRVAIVHSLAGSIGTENIHQNVGADSKSFFQVLWQGEISAFLDEYEGGCRRIGCEMDAFDNYCICSTSVHETAAFSTIPSKEEVLSLAIGSFSPAYLGEKMDEVSLGGGVTMFSENGQISEKSVFLVVENGVEHWRRNVVSFVKIGSAETSPSFRNPMHMLSITSPELREAFEENEEAIKHYVFHPNTAPFLAIRFSQRFGISNPSPRFVNSLATAFRTGSYVHDSVSFGSGAYGDMSAMIAACLLDPESRSFVLDIDPAHGALQEPFLRLMRIFRSLQVEADDDAPFLLFEDDMQAAIGQEPHQMPSVFSFFLPEYTPSGPVGESMLVCPECQVSTGPKIVAMLNGMLSLVKYGLDSHADGFGEGRGSTRQRVLGSTRYATAGQKYATPDEVDTIDDLSTLLTSGRLQDNKKSYLREIFELYHNNLSAMAATITVQQLILLSPEFHTTAVSKNTQGLRPIPEPGSPSSRPYKAVVFVMLEGGYDSFNVLVPYSCEGSDLRHQYSSERGRIALTEDELIYRIDASDQPCSQFALHPALETTKALYEAEHLAFFANAGVLNTIQMNKQNYVDVTPTQLFSHNSMQHETKTVDITREFVGTGILGRAAEVLAAKGYKVNSVSVDEASIAVTGTQGKSEDPIIVSRNGAQGFNPIPEPQDLDLVNSASRLNAMTEKYSSRFGESWSRDVTNAIREAGSLQTVLDGATLGDHWPPLTQASGDEDDAPELDQKFSIIAQLIQQQAERAVDRDVFYASFGSFDHHSNLKENLEEKLRSLDSALENLVAELMRSNKFNDVTIVVASEFARTITPNSGGGSDHAYGGHYFAIGGELNGGKIFGSYPDDISSDSPLNIGRGRILPTTSWDCIWNAICQWLGAETDQELDFILPNRHASSSSTGDDIFSPLFLDQDLYRQDDRARRLRNG